MPAADYTRGLRAFSSRIEPPSGQLAPPLPPPEVPPPRGVRGRVVVRRLVLLRFAGARVAFAAPAARCGAARFTAGLREADARLDPALADFARVDVFAFRVPLALRVLFLAPVERFFVLDDDPELVPALALPSIVHLPDMTRCAASATASAMIEPSFVALDITLVAACDAVSAASSPASRIFRRADGLALIAAAAAARPAASISLLIAALASLSTVSDLDDDVFEVDLEEVLRDEVLRADLAILLSPSVRRKTL